MMNMERHEKVKGDEAFRRLLDGKSIRDKDGVRYFIHKESGKLWSNSTTHCSESNMTANGILRRNWYVRKPFDVRAAMREKPDSWVGAYVADDGAWMKVGFDSKQFAAVEARILCEVRPVACDINVWIVADGEALDKCMEIGDADISASGGKSAVEMSQGVKISRKTVNPIDMFRNSLKSSVIESIEENAALGDNIEGWLSDLNEESGQ